MKELAKEGWNYTLTENESGSLIFSVVSGSIGVYEVKIALTPEEISRYKREGTTYLAALANEIRTNESHFNDRKLPD